MQKVMDNKTSSHWMKPFESSCFSDLTSASRIFQSPWQQERRPELKGLEGPKSSRCQSTSQSLLQVLVTPHSRSSWLHPVLMTRREGDKDINQTNRNKSFRTGASFRTDCTIPTLMCAQDRHLMDQTLANKSQTEQKSSVKMHETNQVFCSV